jgi:MtN3 and saliva related transmembrane protein
MESTEYIGIAAGICTSISQLPQLIKIIKEKKADDISYFMLAILITGLAGWVWYGCMKSDLPIILTNSFSVLINLLMVFFTYRYKK